MQTMNDRKNQKNRKNQKRIQTNDGCSSWTLHDLMILLILVFFSAAADRSWHFSCCCEQICLRLL